MYWENQPELPSDKGSNWSRGATLDIGSPPLLICEPKKDDKSLSLKTELSNSLFLLSVFFTDHNIVFTENIKHKNTIRTLSILYNAISKVS